MWCELLSKAEMLPSSDIHMLYSGEINVKLGDITILLFMVILKHHDNRYRREIFSIVILPV